MPETERHGRVAARRVVCVIPFAADPLRILVLRRPENRVAGWQPVTGRVETHDASLEAACIRELGEETGLPAPLEILDLGQETSYTGYDGGDYQQRAFAARYADAHPIQVSDEHEEAKWLPYLEALARLTWRENREALETLRARLDTSG